LCVCGSNHHTRFQTCKKEEEEEKEEEEDEEENTIIATFLKVQIETASVI